MIKNKKVSGIEALTCGLKDGGLEVPTNFPGYYSHKLFSNLGGSVTSVNEKISYELAWGASFAGKRSAVMLKNVGLNDAADPFLNSFLVGTNAGMVVIVFDDVEVEGSQSRQDSRHYFDFFGGLWLEPHSVQNAYELAYNSFSLSEKFSLPVVIRVTSQLIHSEDSLTRKNGNRKVKRLLLNNKQFVVHPINSKHQRNILEQKNKNIRTYVESLYKTMTSTTDVNVVVGCNPKEEQRFNLKKENIYRIFTYPLPLKKINRAIQNAKLIRVFEQGSNFCVEKIKVLSNNNTLGFSGIIPDHSNGYIVSSNYEKLFKALREVKNSVLVGDLGEYTKDSLVSINACLCFGSSISVGLGIKMANNKINMFSIIGDAAYLHSGKNVIPEALDRNQAIKIIVICNGGSQGTGGQKIPGSLYYQPEGVEVIRLNYYNTSYNKLLDTIKYMAISKKLSVLYLQMNKHE